MSLDRYGTVVVGENDSTEIIISGPEHRPDSLRFGGGDLD
jgi:hypothetical protein